LIQVQLPDEKIYDLILKYLFQEFSDSQLDVLARQYAGLKGRTISIDQANKLRQIFNRIPDRSLDALRKKKIPFLSGLALSRMVQKGMPVREEKEVKKGYHKMPDGTIMKDTEHKKEEEGNAFGKAVMAAKEKGEKEFVFSGKKYNVEAEMDKVNPVAVKKKFKDRKDKDIDNDGDVDDSDKFLHKRRKAISKAIDK